MLGTWHLSMESVMLTDELIVYAKLSKCCVVNVLHKLNKPNDASGV